jgi:NADPH:quinone reductase-like Zn-dependent oxidoreductase
MKTIPSFILQKKDPIPAQDFSGVVAALGPSAPSHLQVGMPVFGVLFVEDLFRGQGTLCEYLCVSARKVMIAPVPEGISMEEVATLGSAGMMAMLSCKLGGVKPGNGYRVLVNGASGGVGSAFTQVVSALGAQEIVGTCSASNDEFVRSLGAARTIDYRQHWPLHEYLGKEYGGRPFDFILDTLGNQDIYTHSPAYLKPDGVYMNVGDYTHGAFWTLWYWLSNAYWPKWLGGVPRKAMMFQIHRDGECSDGLVRLIHERKVKGLVERCFAFEDALDAYDLVLSKRVRGRVVVKVGE